MKKAKTLRAASVAALALLLTLVASLATFSGSFAADTNGAYSCLSDLKVKSSSVGWGTLCVDCGLDDNPIRIANEEGTGTVYKKGFCAHAASDIKFDISGSSAVKFTSYIGLHDGTNNGTKEKSSVDFEVKVDGVSLYKSGTFKISTPAEYISVDIPAGASELELITTGAGDGIDGDHSAWGDPRIWFDDALLNEFARIEAAVGKEEIDLGKSTTINLTGYTYGGDEKSLSGAQISYESLCPQVASVDKKGKITAIGAGGADILCTAVLDGKSASCTVHIKSLDDSICDSWTLSSPDGELSVNVMRLADASISYSVTKGGLAAFDASKVGMKTDLIDLSDGLSFVSEKRESIDEEYKNYSGKRSEGHNKCNSLTLTFGRGDFLFDAEFRAYDDGYAFRTTIRAKDGSAGEIAINDEVSSFKLPKNTTFWATKVNSLTSTFNYEAGYEKLNSSSAKSGYYAFPLLCNTSDGLWMLVSEAELYGDSFVGSMVKGTGDCEYELFSAPITANDPVKTSYPFTSPWRLSVVGELSDVVESDLIENVSARRGEDASWVEPGVTAWMWLSEGFAGQRDHDTIIRYIDMASEMGWKYLILDEGWQPGSNPSYHGYYPWFDEMIEYANEKGVGIIVWILCRQLDTPKEREVLAEYASKGIKGIKCDFFDSEDQDKIATLKAINEECYKNNLIVITHGANKPTGERQYWPNVINRESVQGEEYGGAWTTSTTMWPYLRAALGPVDITPRAYPTGSSSTTQGQQLSMCVVFESGVPCMAGSTGDYLNNEAYSFYKDLPAKWDDIKFISGEVGKYTVLARKTGSSWYIGALTAGSRTPEYALDFLDDGAEYYCIVYNDDQQTRAKTGITIETSTVKKGDTLAIPMKQSGGYVVKLIKKDEANKISAIGFDDAQINCEINESILLDPVITPATTRIAEYKWISSDESIAAVDDRGNVTGIAIGKATISVFSPLEDGVVGKITVNVTAPSVILSDGWEVKNESEDAAKRYKVSKENIGEITLYTLKGSAAKGNIQNLILAPAVKGDFEITVRLDCRFDADTQCAGLIITDAEGKESIFFGKTHDSRASSADSFVFGGGSGANLYRKDTRTDKTVYLKIVRSASEFKAYTSYDNKNWKEMSKSIENSAFGANADIRFGIFACSGDGNEAVKATFSSFTLAGKDYPITKANASVSTDKAVSIADGALPTEISAKAGTELDALGLPEKAQVILESGKTADAIVTWICEKAYDAQEGEYIFTPHLSGVDGADALECPDCTVTLTATGEDGPGDDDDDGDGDDDGWFAPWMIAPAGGIVVIAAAVVCIASGKKKKEKKK